MQSYLFLRKQKLSKIENVEKNELSFYSKIFIAFLNNQ